MRSACFPFRFTGQRYDPETGLYYYKARYYDPAHGRFLQTDPIGYQDQQNMYVYVGNDPVNAVDPSGMQMEAAFDYMPYCPSGGCQTGSDVGNATREMLADRPQQMAAGLGMGAALVVPDPSDLALGAALAGTTKAVTTVPKVADILGNAQQTTKAGELTSHGSTSQRIAGEMAESGDYSSVHMNRTLRSITDGDIDSSIRPDVGAPRLEDGPVDVVEVLSPGQSRAQMELKYQEVLGSRCGTVTCVDPD